MDASPLRCFFASLRTWFARHRATKWAVLVFGSALPASAIMWNDLGSPSSVGVAIGVALWTYLMYTWDGWLIRRNSTSFSAILTKGTAVQMVLTAVVAVCTHGGSLLIIYGPSLVLMIPLSNLFGYAMNLGTTPSWLNEAALTCGLTLTCGTAHLVLALVLGSAVDAASLPRSVVSRRTHRAIHAKDKLGRSA